MNAAPWTVLGIPIDSVGSTAGLSNMPKAFRSAGLLEAIKANDLGDLNVTLSDGRRDPSTGIVAFRQIQSVSHEIKRAVLGMLESGQKPFVVGGCCTLLIGVCAALKEYYGEVGLAFIDGHLDFYDGKSSPNGEGADMELAIISGIGPKELVELSGPAPLMETRMIAAIGFRDEQQAASDGAPDPRTLTPEMRLYDLSSLRDEGMTSIGDRIVTNFERDIGRFWLHIDVDVLNVSIMPAVDYHLDDGLMWDEFRALIWPFALSPALIGVDVTILNPDLDPDRRYARDVVSVLGEIFTPS